VETEEIDPATGARRRLIYFHQFIPRTMPSANKLNIIASKKESPWSRHFWLVCFSSP
jgi:hypothetical protein